MNKMLAVLLTSELKNAWRSKLLKVLFRPNDMKMLVNRCAVSRVVCSSDTAEKYMYQHLLSSTVSFGFSNTLFHRKLASNTNIPQRERYVLARKQSCLGVNNTAGHFEHKTEGKERDLSRTNLFLITVFGVVLFHLAKLGKESLCEEQVKPDNEAGQADGEMESRQNSLKTALICEPQVDQRPHISKEKAIVQAKDLCQRVKDESGSPGLVVAVSVNGKIVWADGFGFADVENRVECTTDKVMRIASISKSITMAAVAKAMENNMLDLDRPVQEYVPQFPHKEVDGEKVTITTRQLVSHLGGIRHYDKKYAQKDESKNVEGKTSAEESKEPPSALFAEIMAEPEISSTRRNLKLTKEFEHSEYFIKKHYPSVEKSLDIFKDDPLVHKPGTKFLYTTHGWTLVAAVLEGATKQKFPDLMTKLFKDLGLQNTYLEEHQPIIYNRARFYARNKKNQLVNAPYVDCSYKYAGGGMMSTASDLVRFGNVMLYSYQLPEMINAEQKGDSGRSNRIKSSAGDASSKQCEQNSSISVDKNAGSCAAIGATEGMDILDYSQDLDAASECRLRGYLKRSTMQQIWSPILLAKYKEFNDSFYAMGWAVVPKQEEIGCGRRQDFYVSHTGGAVGASSVLLIVPSAEGAEGNDGSPMLPRGVVVAIIVNMISVNLMETALKIAKLFEEVSV